MTRLLRIHRAAPSLGLDVNLQHMMTIMLIMPKANSPIPVPLGGRSVIRHMVFHCMNEMDRGR